MSLERDALLASMSNDEIADAIMDSDDHRIIIFILRFDMTFRSVDEFGMATTDDGVEAMDIMISASMYRLESPINTSTKHDPVGAQRYPLLPTPGATYTSPTGDDPGPLPTLSADTKLPTTSITTAVWNHTTLNQRRAPVAAMTSVPAYYRFHLSSLVLSATMPRSSRGRHKKMEAAARVSLSRRVTQACVLSTNRRMVVRVKGLGVLDIA
ncbi:hypothetical protein BJ170DRAFT_735185 [Xylariales sp. AK1849]|nr:hypothetical protein BJ170DRAFT_735185 [Xylariales sp. AK1849]